jgi:CRP/FNR family cyclic AMP-dependent transcriptional regulator
MEAEASKQNVESNLKIDYFAEGEVVFSSGDPSNKKIYFILDGQVSVKRDGFSPSYTNVIYKGSYFGELSLINSFPRNETITVSSGYARIVSLVADDFSSAIKVNKQMLKKLLDSSNDRYNFAVAYFLERRTEIPQMNTNIIELNQIRKKTIEITEKIHTPSNMYHEDKSVIFRENDFTKGSFHIVELGQVTTKRKYNDRGDYIGILNHEEGDIIGEQAYFGLETRRERAVVTSGRVKLREINKSAFEKLINIHTDIYLNFIKVMLWKSYILEQKIKSI